MLCNILSQKLGFLMVRVFASILKVKGLNLMNVVVW
jgi:hypothetical protein